MAPYKSRRKVSLRRKTSKKRPNRSFSTRKFTSAESSFVKKLFRMTENLDEIITKFENKYGHHGNHPGTVKRIKSLYKQEFED